jgi:hypothetical protein
MHYYNAIKICMNAKAHLKHTVTSAPPKYKIAALQKKRYEEEEHKK